MVKYTCNTAINYLNQSRYYNIDQFENLQWSKIWLLQKSICYFYTQYLTCLNIGQNLFKSICEQSEKAFLF